MKNYKAIIIIFLLLLILSPFFPQRICSKSDNVRIDRIVYNDQFKLGKSEYSRIEVEKFDSNAILECLSRYKSHLTLIAATGYQLKNSEIEVFLTFNGRGKHIVLGDVNYEVSSNGKLRRHILNSDSLVEELKSLLCLQGFERRNSNETNS